MFSVFVLIVSSVQLVGKPISCFTSASFTSTHVIYTDFVCWISDTYIISIDAKIPDISDYEKQQASYILRFYQYVPFILMLQTVGFFLPGFFWRNGLSRFGIPLQKYIDQLNMSRCSLTRPPSYRRQLIRNVAVRLNQYLRLNSKTTQSKLTIFYLFIKLIYLINILVQLICLRSLMNFNFNIIELLRRFLIYNNTASHTSVQFPTNVVCDYIVRFLGKNKHRCTVQCVLPINMFNEKIFILSYLWLISLLICTIYNIIIQWLIYFLFCRTIVGIRQRTLYHTLLKFTSDQNLTNEIIQISDYQSIIKNFSQRYLRYDGMLIIRLLDMNIDLVTMTDLTDDLWTFYNHDPF